MSNSQDSNNNSSGKAVDRRRFLQSLFSGLGGGGGSAVTDGQPAAAGPQRAGHGPGRQLQQKPCSFFWTNLRNGQVGFPTGLDVPSGPPGSIMKLVSAAALFESGLYNHSETIMCNGSIEVHNRKYSCLYAHGQVDIIKAVGLSCNVFFAIASQKLPPRVFVQFAERFGFNAAVEGHAAAAFPRLNELKGDSPEYALGLTEDLQPNALQVLRLAACVGLRGRVPVMHNTGFSQESEAKPFVVELAEPTWQMLQQGMRLCGREGTARQLDPEDKLRVSVKTGTAPHGKSFQSWICGYFPADDPKYAFSLRCPAGTSVQRAVPEAHRWLFSAPWP